MQKFTVRKSPMQTTFIGKKRGVVAVQTIPKFPKGESFVVRSSKSIKKSRSFSSKNKALIHGRDIIQDFV